MHAVPAIPFKKYIHRYGMHNDLEKWCIYSYMYMGYIHKERIWYIYELVDGRHFKFWLCSVNTARQCLVKLLLNPCIESLYLWYQLFTLTLSWIHWINHGHVSIQYWLATDIFRVFLSLICCRQVSQTCYSQGCHWVSTDVPNVGIIH